MSDVYAASFVLSIHCIFAYLKMMPTERFEIKLMYILLKRYQIYKLKFI